MSQKVLDYISTRVEVSAAEIFNRFGYRSEKVALHMLHKVARKGLLESRIIGSTYLGRWERARLKLFRAKER